MVKQMDRGQYLSILTKLRELPDENNDKLIRVAGVITDYVKVHYGIDLIIVGGLSVEIYTEGGYTTQDIDFVGPSHQEIMQALDELGFQRMGKDSFLEELKVFVEIPGSTLEDANESYVRKVPTKDGFTLSVIGIEDIIKDRLRAFIHWRELREREWAYTLIKQYMNKIDLQYIRDTLNSEERDVFEKMLEYAQQINLNETKQYEAILFLERESIPFSVLEESIIVLTVRQRHYGFSLYPDKTIYETDEETDENILTPIKENITKDELIDWLKSINDENIYKLILFIKDIFNQ